MYIAPTDMIKSFNRTYPFFFYFFTLVVLENSTKNMIPLLVDGEV